MKLLWKPLAAALCALLLLPVLSGCSAGDKTVIRIGHNQAADHPTNIALLAFKEFIESKLGDKYDVEVYPGELLVTYVSALSMGLPMLAGLV